jgi:Kef-type K+ transport system membrane component KefB/nucleotide-binding universal stress UspA family protein
VGVAGVRPTTMTGFLCGRALATALPLLLISGAAFAASGEAGGAGKPSEVIFLAELILLLVFGRLLGEAMQRIGQPAVMGQLIAGILLGPSVFGALMPELQKAVFPETGAQKSMIDAVSQLGILMLLLLTGMETDLAVVRKAKRAAISVSLTGIAVPFACGVTLGELLPDAMLPDPGRRFITSLFLGTALAISSVKIVAMVVKETGFVRRLVGQVIIASAIIDDTVGWIIMAITFGLAQHGSVDLAALGRSVIGTALFLALSFTLGRRAVFLLIRWANDNFVMEMPVITTILVVMALMALLTHAIGVHTVLGAFVAGILVGQSPILTRHIDEQLRGLIIALFMPVFFGLAGQHTDLGVLTNTAMLALSLGMIAIASVGKFTGAFLGGKLGGMTARESMALACGMNARGSTEVIVATLGLGMGVLNEGLFTTIVAMAVVTTMAMPPMLRWALGRVPLRPDEEQRLEREVAEARGFVSNVERLLVAVDRSPSGRLASRLVGLLAGNRRIPTTVLPVDEVTAKPAAVKELVSNLAFAAGRPAEAAASEAEAVVKSVGERVAPEGEDAEAPPLDVTTRQQEAPVEEAVAEEAKKGYDLLVVGLEPTFEGGEFSRRIARVADGFEGPFAIVAARGPHREDPDRPEHDILVPVTGTGFSRRGAEVALALARASNGSITALYVAGKRRRSWRRRLGVTWPGSGENAILREIVRLGEQHGVPVKAEVRRRGAAEEAILRQLKSGRHELVVMGVSTRPGETLFFGDVPDAILDRAERSVVLVSS